MAKDIILRIKVDDSDLGSVQKHVESLGGSFEEVNEEASKAKTSIKDVGENGGAIAVLDSLTGGLATRIRDAAEASKLFNTNLKATRAALIATGIGAFVVALGVVVAYWDEIVELVTETNAKLEQQIERQEQIVALTQSQLDLTEKRLAANNELGILSEELQEQYLQEIEILQGQVDKEIELLTLQAERIKQNALELSLRDKIVRTLGDALGRGAGTTAILNEQNEALAEFQEIQQRINTLKGQQIDLEVKAFKARQTGDAESDTPTGGGAQQRENAQAVNELQLAGLTELKTQELDIEQQYTEDLQAEIDRRNRIREAELRFQFEQNEARLSAADNLANALFALGEENKAAAVAGIIVDQISSAARAIQANVEANAKAVAAFPLTAGQPWVSINTASTVAGIAAGALAAKKAISEIGGGGSPSSFGAVPQGQTAPAFNLVGTSGVNQLADTLNAREPQRAFVVSTDVTSQQALDRNIVETATIG